MNPLEGNNHNLSEIPFHLSRTAFDNDSILDRQTARIYWKITSMIMQEIYLFRNIYDSLMIIFKKFPIVCVNSSLVKASLFNRQMNLLYYRSESGTSCHFFGYIFDNHTSYRQQMAPFLCEHPESCELPYISKCCADFYPKTRQHFFRKYHRQLDIFGEQLLQRRTWQLDAFENHFYLWQLDIFRESILLKYLWQLRISSENLWKLSLKSNSLISSTTIPTPRDKRIQFSDYHPQIIHHIFRNTFENNLRFKNKFPP